MAVPNKTRGEYRPFYEALFHGKDYKRLSPDAKLCLVTLKGLCGPLGMKVWPALCSSLAELTALPEPRCKQAIRALVDTQWIEYEDGIVWVVRGLEFEPQVSHGVKHRQWVRNQLVALSAVPIVDRFRERYAVFFESPSESPPDDLRHGESRTPSDRVSDRVSHSPPDTTTPSPSPSPSLPGGRDTRTPPARHVLEHAKRLEPDAHELAQLRAVALPHEAFALDYYLGTESIPYAIVAELFAVGSGMHALRGPNTGARVEIQHVMRAVAEMFANSKPWNTSLFRIYVKKVADRPAEAASPEARAEAKLEAEVRARAQVVPVIGIRGEDGTITNVVLDPDDSPEAREARRLRREEAMAQFRRAAISAEQTDPANVWPAKYIAPDEAQAAVA